MKTTIDTIEFIESKRADANLVDVEFKTNPSGEHFTVSWRHSEDSFNDYKLSNIVYSDNEDLESLVSGIIECKTQDPEFQSEYSWLYSAIASAFSAKQAAMLEPELYLHGDSIEINENGQSVTLIDSDDSLYVVETFLQTKPVDGEESSTINGVSLREGHYAKKIVVKAIQEIVAYVMQQANAKLQSYKSKNPDSSEYTVVDGLTVELCFAKGDCDIVRHRPATAEDVLLALQLPIVQYDAAEDNNPDRVVRDDYEIALDLLEVRDYVALLDSESNTTIVAKEVAMQGGRYYLSVSETLSEIKEFFSMCKSVDTIKSKI